MARRVGIWASTVVLWASACGIDAEDERGQRVEGAPCPTFGCGTNAASVHDGLFFYELSRCGQANPAGVVLQGATGPSKQPLQLSVVGDELVGAVSGGGPPLQRQALVGTTLRLATLQPRGLPPIPVDVRLTAVGSTDYWVSPGGPVPTYTFEWQDPSGRTHPLCGGSAVPIEWADRVGQDTALAIVFAGDRYDPIRKTVSSDGTSCWFNVACAGSAAAKMHLLRHTSAGSDAAHATSLPQRQTMLKMITDDLCGTGETFTVNHEKVFYQDLQLWHPFPSAPASIEAMWSDRGALCLDEARRQREDPAVVTRIQQTCAAAHHDLPRCKISAADYAQWPGLAASGDYGYGLSANPP